MAEAESADQNPRFFIAVHVGTGFHAPSNEKALRSTMKRACLAVASVLRKNFKILVFRREFGEDDALSCRGRRKW
ncbi:hypothetical protein U1Q18_030044 [Sarracenia purpurea var. burkii]